DLAHAPRFADLAVSIGTALQGMVVVGHNAEFDVAFLRAEFARAEMPMPVFSMYCTLQASTLYLPELRRRKLADCCAAVGVTNQQAHSALGDACAAAGLVEHYVALDARTGHEAPLTATRALHGGAQPPQAPTPQPATAQAPGPQASLPQASGPQASGPETPAPHASSAPDAEVSASSGLTITEEFQAALDHLHAGHHPILTGKAATGTSTLIRHYLATTARRTLTVA